MGNIQKSSPPWVMMLYDTTAHVVNNFDDNANLVFTRIGSYSYVGHTSIVEISRLVMEWMSKP